MTLTDLYTKIITLPKEVQKAASRAMFYAGFAMQSTEKQMFAQSSSDDFGPGVVETMGAHTLLGQLKGGVHSNQTKELEQKYLRIMDNAPLVQMEYKPVMNKKGEVVGVEAVAKRGEELTKEQLAAKLLSEWECKTDKTDDFPIEYGLKIKRVLVNEDELVENPEAKKEFLSNLYLEYAPLEGESEFLYEYPLEEVTEAVHVKTISSTRKLIEFYTGLSRFTEGYYHYQGEALLGRLKSDITHITLVRRTHRDDEIFVYKIEEMRDVKEVSGKLLLKFEVSCEL